MQYAICSEQCDTKASPARECVNPVTPDENVPKLREQWLKVYENNAFELKVEFENGFYERAEYFDYIDGTGLGDFIGYIPDPDHPVNSMHIFA